MLPLIHIYIYNFIIINHSTISTICRIYNRCVFINDKNIAYLYACIFVMVILLELTTIKIIFSVDQYWDN